METGVVPRPSIRLHPLVVPGFLSHKKTACGGVHARRTSPSTRGRESGHELLVKRYSYGTPVLMG
jgi:hypothetical protein